jgi:hypothetical protein
MPLNTKPGKKIDTLDMHPLFHDDARSQQRIESAGNQCHRFTLLRHDKNKIYVARMKQSGIRGTGFKQAPGFRYTPSGLHLLLRHANKNRGNSTL